jgi:hypothetical protein
MPGVETKPRIRRVLESKHVMLGVGRRASMSEETAYEIEGRPAALDVEVICCVQDWVG